MNHPKILRVLWFLALTGSEPALAQNWSMPLAETEQGIHRAESLAFTPDGRWLVTAGHFYDRKAKRGTAEIRLWDAAAAEVKKTFRGRADSYTHRSGSLAISPNGKVLAAAGHRRPDGNKPPEHVIELWDLAAEKIQATLTGHQQHIVWVTFSPDGKTLASASGDAVIVWDLAGAKEILTLRESGVWPVVFAPDGETLALGDDGGGITFLNCRTGKAKGTIQAKGDVMDIGCLAFSPGSRLLAGGGQTAPGRSGVIRVWELTALAGANPAVVAVERYKLEGHEVDSFIYSVVFSPDGTLLASCAQDKTVCLWDVCKGQAVSTLEGHTDFVYGVAFSPDGKLLASVGRGALKVWSVADARKKRR